MTALLQINQLAKHYGVNKAVDGINFVIREGRCAALLGPNGAGKTTTLKMLSGLLQPTGGSIDFSELDRNTDRRKYIGYLPQYPAFYPWMSGHEFLIFAGQLAHLSRKEAVARTEEMLDLVGLKDAKNRRIGGYSGGMKQRLGLAQAMIHRPKLLILDEPVSALDPLGRRELLNLLLQIKNETTILFSTHVLHDAEQICDDILIMQKGEIAVQGDLEEVRRQYQRPLIYVRTEPSGKEWLSSLGTLPHVKEVDISGHQATLIVDHLAEAKKEILERIVGQNVPIERFEVGRTTLEDLFIEVVKS